MAARAPEIAELPEKADPLADPENKKKLALAKEFALQLAKGIKNIGIYRHNASRFPEMVQRALEAVARYTEAYGPLTLKVETQCFSLFKQPVFEAGDAGENLPYKFYRDGIRHLIFRAGITPEEFLQFVMIALSDPERSDDVLSQMWNATFAHIEYIVVEGFAFDDMSEEEVQVEVDKVVAYLYRRLRSTSDDYLRFARLSAEDLDTKLENVEQVRGAVITGSTASPKLVTQLQEELKEDVNTRLFPKLVGSVFQVLEDGGAQDVDILRDVYLALLDAMLLQEDFATVNAVLARLRGLERNPQRSEAAEGLRTFLQAKMGEEHRLRRVGEILNAGKHPQPDEVLRYLQVVPPTAVITLLDILETIEVPENRAVVCDALVVLGRGTPEPFIQRLDSEKSQLVRDMISVIDRCDFPDKYRFIGQALRNPNLAVRLEVLGTLSRSRSEQSRRFVVAALDDENSQMRLQAARLLPAMSGENAMSDLLRVIKSQAFERRDLKERMSVYKALGSTGNPAALPVFTALLAPKGLLERLRAGKAKEDRLLAVAGLGAMPSIPSYKALQAVAEEAGQDREVALAARRAGLAMRRALFGDVPQGPDDEGVDSGSGSTRA